MQVTSATTPAAAASTAATTSSSTDTTTGVTEQTLGEDDFLKLLAPQLSAQDPMQPTDDPQFISQMASFSSLQQMSTLNTNFTGFATSQTAAQAPSYLGKQVSVTDSTGTAVSGIATGYHVSDGAVTLTINGTDYPVSSVTGVSLPTS